MLPAYIQIIEKLKMQGHTVVSEHVASEVLEETEAKITDEEIFKNDLGYIDRCECLVAEVTVSSIGVGYEIGYAVSKGKLVLCIYREEANVSAWCGETGKSYLFHIRIWKNWDISSRCIYQAIKNQTTNSGL